MASAKLQITVVSAHNLYNADSGLAGKSDPYVIVEVPGQEEMKFQTNVIDNSLNPVWNYTGTIDGFMDGDVLQFTVMDKDCWPKSDDLLGRAALTAQDFYPEGFHSEIQLSESKTQATLTVMIVVLGSNVEGEMEEVGMGGQIQAGMEPQMQVGYENQLQPDMGQPDMGMPLEGGGMLMAPGEQALLVNVMNARGLYNADGFLAGKSDPYCICLIPEKPKHMFKTPVIDNCLDPDWNHEGRIEGFQAGDSLEFQVWDSDTFPKPDQLLGKVTLTPQDFAAHPDGLTGVLQLTGGKSGEELGTLEICIQADTGAAAAEMAQMEMQAAGGASAGVEVEHEGQHHIEPTGVAVAGPGGVSEVAVADGTSGEQAAATAVANVTGQLAGARMGRLQINIVKANNLYNADGCLAGKSDPYVVCLVPEKRHKKFQTKVINNNLDPVWNHVGLLNGFIEGESLEFQVWDKDTFPKPDDALGKVVLSSHDFFPQGLEGELALTDSKAPLATLTVRIEVLPDQEHSGLAGAQVIPNTVYQQPGCVAPIAGAATTTPVVYTSAARPVPTGNYPTTYSSGVQPGSAYAPAGGLLQPAGYPAQQGMVAAPVATKVEYQQPAFQPQPGLSQSGNAFQTYSMPASPATYTVAGDPGQMTREGTLQSQPYVMPVAAPTTTVQAPMTYITGQPPTPGMEQVAYTGQPMQAPASTYSAPSTTYMQAPVTYSAPSQPAMSYRMPSGAATFSSPGTAPHSMVTVGQGPTPTTTYTAAPTAGPCAPQTFMAAPSNTYAAPRMTFGAPMAAPATMYPQVASPQPTMAAAPMPRPMQSNVMMQQPAGFTQYAAPAPVTYAAPGATFAAAPQAGYVMQPAGCGTPIGFNQLHSPGKPGASATLFERLDANQDGVITRSEFNAAFGR